MHRLRHGEVGPSACLTGRPVLIADLRRTSASFMISTGSDLMMVGKSLGHTQASTTQRYAMLFEDVRKAGVSRAVGRMLNPVV